MKRTLGSLMRGDTSRKLGPAFVLAAVVIALAPALPLGTANQLTSLLLLVVLALSWNLVGGYGGQFSLGHSIFVGIGAYATAVLVSIAGLPLIVAVIAAGIVSAAIGVLLAYPLLRLRGPYLSVGSLGMALAAYGWMINWDFTNASSSFPLPRAALVDVRALLIWATVLALLAFAVVVLVTSTQLGFKLIALRDDEAGAASIGVRRLRTLVPVWAISGMLAGLMGTVYAMQRGSLSVDAAFAIQFSLDAAIICVIGGLGTLSGPLIGAVVVYYLRFFAADFSDWSLLIEACVLLLVVRFFPAGLSGLLGSLRARFGAVAGKRGEVELRVPLAEAQ